MKKLNIVILLFLAACRSFAQEPDIGEEYIEPLKYPKLSLSGEYGILRKFRGFSEGLSGAIPTEWGGAIGIDVGLYRYFNAGVIFSTNLPLNNEETGEPFFMRFTLFAKPYIPIGERFSFFSRIGGGISYSAMSMLGHLYIVADDKLKTNLQKTYYTQDYSLLSPGANAMASLGMEFFPFSRIGFALEWAFRMEYYYSSRGSFLAKYLGINKVVREAPNSFQYLKFDMPIFLTLHVIL